MDKAPVPRRYGIEPILFKVPEEDNKGEIATTIRDKVAGMYKSEADAKQAKTEAEAELVKEAMEFAGHVGVHP